MSYLILLNEDGSTRIFKVDKPQVGLGFKDDNDVCIPVTGVSRHHARILNEGDHVFLEDLGSTNKTQIDGTAISKQEISHDTTFVLGKCVPVLYLDDIDHGAVSRFISNFSKDDSFETKLVQPYQQAEDREFKELVSLFEIASDIKSTHDLDTVLKSILDRVLILTGAQRGFVILIENGEFTVKLRRGRDVDELDPEALSMSVAQKAIETKTTQMFTRPAIGTISMPSSIEEYRINSLMCAPLVVKKQVIGCIYIDIRKSEAAFSDRDATLFTAMAHQAALAIDTSRMVLDQKHRLEEQEFLYEISRGLNVDEDMESLLKKCLDQIREVLGAERTSLMMYDPVTKCLQTRFVAGVDRIIDSPILLKLGEGIAGRVALQSKGILINGATDDERFKKILERDGNVNRIMCAPLVSMKACIGVINVVNTRNGRDFTQGDLSLLSSVANLAALCIEKQRANLERIRRERLNQQYEDALKIERLMIRDPVEGEEESVQPVLIKTQAGASVEEDHADRMQALYDRLKDDYKDLQRLQDLRRNLTDMIVHDLRSPLGSASGFLELLQGREGTRLSKSGQSWLEKAMRSTRSIIEMVNSMLDISRLEEGKLKVEIWPQDLTEIVKEAINLLEGSFPTELINRSFPTVARTVYCDKSLIVRVVTNLLGNAIKFCPRGQPIDVSIEFSGEEVTVSVVDHGIGIPEKYHEKIFEKFGQVEARKDRSVPSTGLGLTFCKLVVDSHRGTIGVESAPNEGSRFWFSLPLDPQGRESATP